MCHCGDAKLLRLVKILHVVRHDMPAAGRKSQSQGQVIVCVLQQPCVRLSFQVPQVIIPDNAVCNSGVASLAGSVQYR